MRKKYLSRKALLLFSVFALAGSCFGDSITIASNSTETTNNYGSPTVVVTNPDPYWISPFVGSSWVSYTSSGNPNSDGFVLVPNGTSVDFADTFTLDGTPTGGSLEVAADDSASITVNGTVIYPLASTVGNTYYICSDYTVGCLANTVGNFTISSSLLQPGINTISFDVVQQNLVAFGLDYAGTVDYSAAATAVAPEPATIALIGVPLVGLSLIRKRKA
jgi:hypothetical protein